MTRLQQLDFYSRIFQNLSLKQVFPTIVMWYTPIFTMCDKRPVHGFYHNLSWEGSHDNYSKRLRKLFKF